MKLRRICAEQKLLIGIYMACFIVCLWVLESSKRGTYCFYFMVMTVALGIILLAEQCVDKRKAAKIFTLGIICTGWIMTFRDMSGIDDPSYFYLFMQARGKTIWEYLNLHQNEIGYEFLSYCLYQISGGNYFVAQVFFSALAFFLWGIAIWKYKDELSITYMSFMMIYLYYFHMMAVALVRIFIVIPIILLAIRLIWKKKVFEYLVCILGASLIHRSAMFMLIFIVFMVNKDFWINNWKLISIIMIGVIPILIVVVSKMLVPLFGKKYIMYTIGNFHLSLSDLDLLPILALAIWGLFYIPKEYRNLYILSMVMIVLSIILSIYSSLVDFGRLSFYMNLGILICFSMLYKLKLKKANVLLIVSLMTAYCFAYSMHTVFLNYEAKYLIPYYHIWGSIGNSGVFK